MTTEQFLPALAGFTLVAILVVAVGMLLAFMRKRRNRAIVKKTLTE